VQMVGAGSIFNTHFAKEPIRDAFAASRADKKKLFDYNMALMTNGVFFLPTHAQALSTAHSKADIEKLFNETEAFARHHNKS